MFPTDGIELIKTKTLLEAVQVVSWPVDLYSGSTLLPASVLISIYKQVSRISSFFLLFSSLFSMMCQFGVAESKSATFSVKEKARHLLDDSFLESHSPVRNHTHDSVFTNGISLGPFLYTLTFYTPLSLNYYIYGAVLESGKKQNNCENKQNGLLGCREYTSAQI